MAGKSDVTENDILNLYFKAIAIAGIAINHGTPLTQIWLSLMTGADPGDTLTALTQETAYTGYARMPITRGAGFTVTGNSVSPAADVTFGLCTASPGGNITQAAYVDTASGAGKVFWYGPLTAAIVMGIGVTPKILATSTVTED